MEFEQFDTCWDSDRLKAQGLVAQIQRLINVKDSFTRMNAERVQERQQRMAAKDSEAAKVRERTEAVDKIKANLGALFGEQNPHKRGKALEDVLNRLFRQYGVLVRDAFVVRTNEAGVVEQIDGVIELQGRTYIVEMKWLKESVGPNDIGLFLSRVYGRGDVGGIFISSSGYSPGALEHCRVALAQKTIVLATIEELVLLLNSHGDLVDFFRRKVDAARLERNAFFEIRFVITSSACIRIDAVERLFHAGSRAPVAQGSFWTFSAETARLLGRNTWGDTEPTIELEEDVPKAVEALARGFEAAALPFFDKVPSLERASLLINESPLEPCDLRAGRWERAAVGLILAHLCNDARFDQLLLKYRASIASTKAGFFLPQLDAVIETLRSEREGIADHVGRPKATKDLDSQPSPATGERDRGRTRKKPLTKKKPPRR